MADRRARLLFGTRTGARPERYSGGRPLGSEEVLTMATQTFTLAEAPARFRFRVGDRVARTDAEGYADLEHAGVVADGRWTGDPSGGSYDETYRIRRDDGNYFRAREIHLLGLFDDASLREEIR